MSGAGLAVRCPAKVNLVLRVLARRDDGYHELDTVFQAIDLWDRLSLAPAETLSLECDQPGVPIEGNLVLRAARALWSRGREGEPRGRLVLLKAIPVQAGLGGGSSDAAAALVLCNRGWELGATAGELEQIGRELGADVPFFLTGGTARGRGRGDRIEPLPFVGATDLLLGTPPFGISTAEVFGRLRTRLTGTGNTVTVPLLLAHKCPEQNDFGFLANDLEGVVFEGWPELRVFRDALLEAGAGAALVSGSGSTVFGVFPGSATANGAMEFVRARFPEWRVVETTFVRDGVRWEGVEGRSGEPTEEA